MCQYKNTVLAMAAILSVWFSMSILANIRIYDYDNDLDVQELVEGVLNGVLDPSTTTNIGQTALVMPAMAGNIEMVNKILERGVNPNQEDLDHNTPLSYAVHGVSMQDTTRLEEQPSVWAKKIFENGGKHLEVVKLLLAKDPSLDNLLHGLLAASKRGEKAIAEAIIPYCIKKLQLLPQDQLTEVLSQAESFTKDNPELLNKIQQALIKKEEL